MISILDGYTVGNTRKSLNDRWIYSTNIVAGAGESSPSRRLLEYAQV